MFDQAPINRLGGLHGRREASFHPADGDAGGVRRLLADVTELAELQARLVASDAKGLAESIIKPTILATIGFVIVLGAVPVLLLSCANFLVEWFDWTPAVAQLAAAAAALLIAGTLCAFAVKLLKACGSPLRRSLAELEKNMDILRDMLQGKSPLASHLEQMERHDSGN
jgi:hypothetical protein